MSISTTVGEGGRSDRLLASSGQKPRMLLNVPQDAGGPSMKDSVAPDVSSAEGGKPTPGAQ